MAISISDVGDRRPETGEAEAEAGAGAAWLCLCLVSCVLCVMCVVNSLLLLVAYCHCHYHSYSYLVTGLATNNKGGALYRTAVQSWELPLPALRRQVPRWAGGAGGEGSLPDLGPLGPICEKNRHRGFAAGLCETQAALLQAVANQVLPVECPRYRSWILQLEVAD